MLLSCSANYTRTSLITRHVIGNRIKRLMAAPAHSTSSSSSKPLQGTPFTGTTEAQLAAWLAQYGIPVQLYGTGAFKSIGHLLQEVQLGESVLTAQRPPGPQAATPQQPQQPQQQQQQQEGEVDAAAAPVLRRVAVLNLYIQDPASGRVLMEAAQQLPGGALRRRGVPLAEKLLPGEGWRGAAGRAVGEELGSVLTPGWQQQLHLLEETYRCQVETAVSTSYPGLVTQFTMHRVEALLPGLPTANSTFQTQEQRPEGVLVTTWEWRQPGS